MRKKLLPAILIFALLSVLYMPVKAQKLSNADSLQNSYANKRAKSVYFELLGPGALYSANYDIRFKNRQDGWGGRAGISYYASDGDHLFTMPLVVNYLAGKHGKYFEVGGGITYYNALTNDVFFGYQGVVISTDGGYSNFTPKSDNGIYGTLNFGYRYQPLDGGFSFRGGVSPIFTSDQFVPYWPYISFGYTF